MVRLSFNGVEDRIQSLKFTAKIVAKSEEKGNEHGLDESRGQRHGFFTSFKVREKRCISHIRRTEGASIVPSGVHTSKRGGEENGDRRDHASCLQEKARERVAHVPSIQNGQPWREGGTD